MRGVFFWRHGAPPVGSASRRIQEESIPPYLLDAARCLPDKTRATSAVPRHGMSPASHQPAARAHARCPRLRPDELRPASFNKAPNCYFRDRQSTALTSAQLDENMRTGQGAKSAAAGKPSGPLSLRQSGWIRGERRGRGSLASKAENLQFRQRCSSGRAKAFKGYGTLGCNSTGPTNREIAASPCGSWEYGTNVMQPHFPGPGTRQSSHRCSSRMCEVKPAPAPSLCSPRKRPAKLPRSFSVTAAFTAHGEYRRCRAAMGTPRVQCQSLLSQLRQSSAGPLPRQSESTDP